jgi:hypothetical protein
MARDSRWGWAFERFTAGLDWRIRGTLCLNMQMSTWSASLCDVYGVYMDWNMRVVRLIICLALLMCLLSTSLVGCGINRPPVKSLEQWERDSNRVRSRE